MLLTVEHLTKYHNEKCILKDVSFTIDEHDKVGVIGVNGTGKTTFLKMLAELEHYDDGTLMKKNGMRIHYLAQNPQFEKDCSIMEEVRSHVQKMDDGIEEFEIKTILTKLGLSEFDKKVSHLSGGQKKRVALACALVSSCDLLILDEPTNHLDNDMTLWLETYLKRYTKALLMVTHDRYFLERITTSLLEIDGGKLYRYDGNYETYLDMKQQRMQMDKIQEKKRTSLYKKELEWMRAGVQARGTKSKSRIDRFYDLREQRKNLQQEELKLSSLSSRLGRTTIEIEALKKSFGDHLLFEDFTYNFKRNDRIGIIGNNGCGKSTLLNILAGDLPYDQGSIVIGETVKLGYFRQGDDDMDLSKRVIDYIREVSDAVETLDGVYSAGQMLEKFMFPSQLQHTQIKRLSGGERRRLYLLHVLMQAPNVLLLDEPTNDLDIQTLSILEDYLDDFPGIIVAVSHDRYFLDRIVDHVFVFQDNRTIKSYPGGYSDYLERCESVSVKENKVESSKEKKTSLLPRFTSAEKKELETIDDVIMQLEQQIKEIDQQMETYSDDFEKLAELSKQRDETNILLEEKSERWMYLNEKQQEIAEAKKR